MTVQYPDTEVLLAMVETGGSFAGNLARAWLHADPVNSAKLFACFREIYVDYEYIVRDERERRDVKGDE